MLIYSLIYQGFSGLLQRFLAGPVRILDHALQDFDWLRHRATLGSRCAGRGVFCNQRAGSLFDVVGLVLRQGLACVRAFTEAGVSQSAVGVGCALHAQLGQDLLAHAKVGFHVGQKNAAQLVVEHVQVLWAQALGQCSDLRIRHVLLLAQKAFEEILALLLGGHEGFFNWLARLRGERIKQRRQLLLILVDTCLDGLQFLGAQLLQQLCLAAEQRAVHGALGYVKHKACIRDPRIGQRGLQLLKRLLSFGALVDWAEHLCQLAFGALDQDVGDDVDQGQTVAARQASNCFLFHLAQAALCTFDFVYAPARSFDAGQA